MKKNDNIGTLHSTGETKVGGVDDLEVKEVSRKAEASRKNGKGNQK